MSESLLIFKKQGLIHVAKIGDRQLYLFFSMGEKKNCDIQ